MLSVAFAASAHKQNVENKLLLSHVHRHGPSPLSCSERVPRFAWALVLLLLLEGVMLWRYQPWAVPIEVAPPPPAPLA